jgi:peptidoglycan/xylan/chitin deacetylase (PgdA/CDA1 family)
MQYLKENRIRVLTMDAFFDFLDFKRPIPPKSVVITIDDDWRSAYAIAYPILKKYGYPATLFVYTDSIPERSVDWNVLDEMSRNGIDIQCHTKTHRYLDRKNGAESFREYFESLKRELTVSTDLISKHLNKRVNYLAYPYGETNALVIALAKKLGYRGAFTVKRGANPSLSHHYQINRSMIYGHYDLREFERNLVYFVKQEFD